MRPSIKRQDTPEQKPVIAEPKRLNLLNAIEQIVELSEDSGLNEQFFTDAARYIRYVGKKMHLTSIQAVLFAIFVDNSDDNNIHLSDFARHFRCRTVRIIRYMSDVDELERRKLVICCRERREKS